jgi:hypothetical protein
MNFLKTISYILLSLNFGFSQCEEGFIFIEEIPSTVTMWPADSCFYTFDFLVLEDVMNENELSSYNSPLEMGTQTWINGRLKNWVADYNFSGSGLTEPISILPESIGNWTELSYLALQWNNLTEIPESIGQLSSLSSLYISNNQLGSLPESIGDLSTLFFLDLGYNQIEAIPGSFCNLTNLSYLWIFNNELSAIPECICDLNIDWSGIDGAWYPYFAIGGNFLCENLPDCIENSEHLDISLDQFIYSFMVEDPQECGEESIDITIYNDWNLVGLPLIPEDVNYTEVFPTAIPGTCYFFDEAYVPTQELLLGMGYWLRFYSADTVLVSGSSIDELTLTLDMDWNLISGLTTTLNISQINDPNNLIIPGTIYGFGDTYYQVSELLPGSGYWMRANGSGNITLSDSAPLAKSKHFLPPKYLNRLTLNNTSLYFGNEIEVENPLSYSLPPKPPAPSTDIRFSGDTKLCLTDECVIEVMNNGSPLEFECDIKKCESWEFVDKSGNVFKCEGVRVLDVSGESDSFVLRKSTSPKVPTEFALHPAHPNPFNPVTTIQFSVPSSSDVSMKIYDLQGRLVHILVDEKFSPGNHSITWNADGVSSGVYIVLFERSGQREIQKVVLVK